MSGILMVPIHLDALCLKTDLSVVDAKADFMRLPFWDGAREVNPDIANISEELLSRPLQDRGLRLRAGVHLHWSLPDALTRGFNKSDSQEKRRLSFPAVPNRWLVTRSRRSSDDSSRVECQWIVESDYLHPPSSEETRAGTTIPFPVGGQACPYRFLGRYRLFTDQWSEDDAADSLTRLGYQLTAVGYEPAPGLDVGKGASYGEPTFAAFYPNCQSVFGFYDAASTGVLAGTQYDLIGWYSDDSLDCLRTAEFQAAIDKIKAAQPEWTDDCAKREALKQFYQWEASASGEFPDRTVCYARLVVRDEPPSNAAMLEKAVTVAVGNTATEALSAYMAESLGKGEPLEELLEALHLVSKLEGKQLDVGLKFQEARHEKGFTAVPAGMIWGIREESSALPPVNNRPGEDKAKDETLPDELAHLLNQLNLQQRACDHAAQELESMRKQLFTDWYKYMLCAYPPDDTRDDYPDVDEVRYFIEKNDLLPIQHQRAKFNALDFRGQRSLIALKKAVYEFRERTKKPYAVQPRPAPRYWRPNEPALLIVDETVKPTLRHGRRLHADGLLACQTLPQVKGAIEKHLPAILAEIHKLQLSGNEEIGFSFWSRQPWNPFALEWSVEVFSRKGQNNLDPEDRAYESDFISAHYGLGKNAIDLELLPGQEAVQKAASIYIGSSLLTPHAKFQLQEQIQKFLENRKLKGITGSDPVVAELKDVLAKLDDPGFHALAQSLNGFNEALLMHKQTMQLPIADPLGFADARRFTGAVREAVGNQNRSAPQPLDDFHPIRAGIFRVLALRLVDTFGRTQDLKLDNNRLIASKPMKTAGNSHLVSLPPRLVQPARLNFRWLSADHGGHEGELEMNAHPATKPVCGWLVTSILDGSLMVYDNQGHPLGSIDSLCKWQPSPGQRETSVQEIKNFHLKTLVGHLLHQGPDQFSYFLAAVESALENIDPEGFAQHEAMALLIGRPIAVVRATLALALHGQPAINADWNVFRLDLERDLTNDTGASQTPALRNSDQFTRVRFPIRLGDERQLNDGLVGYWKENWKEDDSSYDYACETAHVNQKNLASLSMSMDSAQKTAIVEMLKNRDGVVKRHRFLARFANGAQLWQLLRDQGVIEECEPRIRFAADEPDLFQSIDDAPQKLTMLVDPRGAVHASCGLLPTKAIHIPSDQFVHVLQNLAVTFFSSPILTERGKATLPLPVHPGYDWSWMANVEGNWQSRDVSPVNLQAGWAEATEIVEGWLRLMKSQK